MPEMIENMLEPKDISTIVGSIDPSIARILNSALEGNDISVDEGTLLFSSTGLEFTALEMVADELRRREVGDLVTYVVNRNVNFTNVCIKRCGFCAFSRDFRQDEGLSLIHI